jgi:hypothetical protein
VSEWRSADVNRSGDIEVHFARDLLQILDTIPAELIRRLSQSLAPGKMHFEAFSFGSIRIDGVTYEHDVTIDRGRVSKRKKKPSKKFRDDFGHTPLSLEEKIPWKCRRLVIGTGTGALPVMEEVKSEAQRRRVKLIILPTAEAIEELKKGPPETNAILHVTC